MATRCGADPHAASGGRGWRRIVVDGRRPACGGGRTLFAGGDTGGSNGGRRLPLQAPCSIPLCGLRQRWAAVRERLPGDPGWLQKRGLRVIPGLWATSEEMVRESTADTPTVFLSRIALSPIGPSRVGCIDWPETLPHAPQHPRRAPQFHRAPSYPRPAPSRQLISNLCTQQINGATVPLRQA